MKARWNQPGFKEQYSNRTRGNRPHSEETKLKISEAIKLKWQDEEYRNLERPSPSPEQRAKASATLKAKWEDEEFRKKMLSRQNTVRSDEWKAMVSEKIKKKWLDPEYRNAVENSLRDYYRRNPQAKSSRQRHRAVAASIKISREESIRRKQAAITERKAQAKLKKELLRKAKLAAKDRINVQSLKDIMGDELWMEEKLKRKGNEEIDMSDTELESVLRSEWGNNYYDEYMDNEDSDDGMVDDDELEYIEYDDSLSDHIYEEDGVLYVDDDSDYFDDDDNNNMVEVYDENGNLVGLYSVEEFQRMKATGSL